MSAVPKKKLCWNCEGNVARDIDNCPYCAVYLHASEVEEDNDWNPSYQKKSNKTEEIPVPPFRSQLNNHEIDTNEEADGEKTETYAYISLLMQLKGELFPILFLMMGSIFFLFGIVLLLFSVNGTFTLQWQESQAFYFLLFAIPLIGWGWKLLQRIE